MSHTSLHFCVLSFAPVFCLSFNLCVCRWCGQGFRSPNHDLYLCLFADSIALAGRGSPSNTTKGITPAVISISRFFVNILASLENIIINELVLNISIYCAQTAERLLKGLTCFDLHSEPQTTPTHDGSSKKHRSRLFVRKNA